MKRLLFGCISVLCLSAAGGLLWISIAAADALRAWAAAPARLEAQIDAARADARRESGRYRLAALAVAEKALIRADARAGEALARTDVLRADVGLQLDAANRSLAEIAAVRRDLQPALEAAARTTGGVDRALGQVNDALPLFLDCDHNPDCLYNRYVGVAQSGERAARAIAVAMPDTAQAFKEGAEAGRDLARSGANIAKSWEKQTPLYVRVIGWAVKPVVYIKSLFGW
jgi:hypothetical protein